MAFYRYLAATAADSPVISWQTLDLSAGTVYGNAALVTARDATTITIDPSEAAGSFLDNSPDNRSDYWWASQAVDLSDWPADSPALLMLEVIRGDSAPSHGTVIGIAFHSSADPTASTAYAGVWIRRKTNSDADGWSINNMGQIGGYFSSFANRQRATLVALVDADRAKLLAFRTRYLDADGNSANNAQNIVSSATPTSWDITGGLWVSLLCGAYQPNDPADAASVHTPISVRYAVAPFGANPT